jgi:hypothetical protein
VTGRYAACEHWTIRRTCDLCNTPEDLERDRLRQQVERLTRERDEARAELARLQKAAALENALFVERLEAALKSSRSSET